MKVEEPCDFDVVIFSLIANPIRKAARFNSLERTFPGETLRTWTVPRGLAVPFEAVCAVEVEAFAESECGLLAVLTPKAVILPRVDIAVRVEGWNEYPVISFEELGHGLGFAVGSDEGIGNIVDRRCADPFASVRAPGDNDSLAGRTLLFRIGWMHTNAKCRNIPALVGYTNIDHADMGWKERA